jgi:hypothetical protein
MGGEGFWKKIGFFHEAYQGVKTYLLFLKLRQQHEYAIMYSWLEMIGREPWAWDFALQHGGNSSQASAICLSGNKNGVRGPVTIPNERDNELSQRNSHVIR